MQKTHDWRSIDEEHGACVNCGVRWYDGSPEPSADCHGIGFMNHETLSSWIRASVTDSRGIDRDHYHPNAKWWHAAGLDARNEKKICFVCFAGAFLANHIPFSANIDDLEDLGRRFQFSKANLGRFYALDFVRCGELVAAIAEMSMAPIPSNEQMTALMELQGELDSKAITIQHPEFLGWDQFDAFLTSMETVADRLEAIGL